MQHLNSGASDGYVNSEYTTCSSVTDMSMCDRMPNSEFMCVNLYLFSKYYESDMLESTYEQYG